MANEGTEKKPGVKIQDLSPKKDAKGGATRPNAVNPNAANPNAVNQDGVSQNRFEQNSGGLNKSQD